MKRIILASFFYVLCNFNGNTQAFAFGPGLNIGYNSLQGNGGFLFTINTTKWNDFHFGTAQRAYEGFGFSGGGSLFFPYFKVKPFLGMDYLHFKGKTFQKTVANQVENSFYRTSFSDNIICGSGVRLDLIKNHDELRYFISIKFQATYRFAQNKIVLDHYDGPHDQKQIDEINASLNMKWGASVSLSVLFD